MTTWKVRPVDTDDRTRVVTLAPELLTGMPPWRPAAGQRAAVTAWVTDSFDGVDRPDQMVFVADDDGAVVGFVGVVERTHFTGEREGYVGELVVARHRRGHGIARSLMVAAEGWARARGLGRVTLETGSANTGARAFYSRLGHTEEQVTLTRALR